MKTYPRYIENFGTIAPGETVTRSIKATVFGGAGQTLTLPVTFYYGTGSNAIYKNSSYILTISTTPLSVSIDSLTETVSGKPLTFTHCEFKRDDTARQCRSYWRFPFGFSVTSSSHPLNNSSVLLGTLAPGARSKVTITGTLTGQDNEQRVFHFTVGTAKSAQDQTLAVTYMTQDTSITITAPFITTTLALNGDTSPTIVLAPNASQNVSLSYTNTLPTSITDAIVVVTLSSTAVDYDSIKSTSGFYNSATHSVIFSKDTDPALAVLAPSAFGVGTFTFQTLPASSLISAPTVIFTTSVSGTRVGQSNVPVQVSASATTTAKVTTDVVLPTYSLYSSGPLKNIGPIPPQIDQATTYSIVWNVQNKGSAVAGGVISAVLPNYVTYTDLTTGIGSFSYNDASRTVTWNTGDLVQGASAQGVFQVSLIPSISQRGSAVSLTRIASFSGYDRFAGVQVAATADSVTIETKGDSGYSSVDGAVQ